MRPQSHLRAASALGLAGVLTTAITPAVAAPAAAPVPAAAAAPAIAAPTAIAPTSTPSIRTAIKDHTLHFGQAVAISGRLLSAVPATPLRLEFRAAGTSSWLPLRSARTAADGRFVVRAHVRRSGSLRVVQLPVAASAATTTTDVTDAAPAPAPASAERSVRVGARIDAAHVHRNVVAGRSVRVSGAVRPRRSGRTVALQLRSNGRWHTVARDRTGRTGAFRLHERLRGASSVPARLRFAGDRVNGAAARSLGLVNVYRPAFASWYGPGLYGQPLGCGGTLTTGTIGVANKTLPCGTKLTLRYHGRSVRASVVDRGPYVAGREFDLTAATKAKLGFGSTGYVQVTR